MSKRPRRPVHRFFLIFYLVGIGIAGSVPLNILQSFFSQGPAAFDPSHWEHLYLIQVAQANPIIASAIGILCIIFVIIGRRLQQLYDKETLTVRLNDVTMSRLRQTMLTNVSRFAQRQLDQSLHGEIMLILDIQDRSDLITPNIQTFSLRLSEQTHLSYPKPTLLQIFDDGDRRLLILGEPGAGKTTALLGLAQDLISRAKVDEALPIPVLFNLSSWSRNRKTLVEWMIEELNKPGYDVPERLARSWIDTGALLPMLDGLDEVALPWLADCVQTINGYRPSEGIRTPLVVCCRIDTFMPLTHTLDVQRATIIEPLTDAQIVSYLDGAKQRLVGLKEALSEDTELHDMAQTPLMLSIMALTYENLSSDMIITKGISTNTSIDERRRQIFERYVHVQLNRQRGSHISRYKTQQTLHWLSWLANLLQEREETRFYLETLQPHLIRHWTFFILSLVLLFGLFDGAVFGLVATYAYGINVGVGVGIGSFLFGSFFGVLGGKGLGSVNIRDKWKFDANILFVGIIYGGAFGIAIGLVYGLIVGLAFGIVIGFVGGLFGSLGSIPIYKQWKLDISGFAVGFAVGRIFEVVYGLIVGSIVGVIVGLGIGLALGSILDLSTSSSLSLNEAGYVRINTGIIRTRNNGIIFGLFSGITSGIIIGQGYGLSIGLAFGFVCGLVVGFGVGLGDFAKYCFVRLGLAQEGVLPLNYVAFLDNAQDRVLVRRSGGGYEFIHRLVREYFAGLEPEWYSFFKERERET